MTIPRIRALWPRAGLEGGRLTLTGDDLWAPDAGGQTIRVGGAEARPLIASPGRLVLPIPGEARSGRVAIERDGEIFEGPTFVAGAKLAGDLHPVANPAIDGEGNIFTTVSGSRGQQVPVSLFKITPAGTVTPLASAVTNPTGLAFNQNGDLFASCRHDGSILRLTPVGDVHPFASGLGIATGIAFDAGGTLFVGDRTGTIHAVSREGRARPFAELPASVAAFHLAFGPDGALYVTAPTLSNDDPIYRITPEGSISEYFRGLARPQGLAFDEWGNLYVVAIFRGDRGILQITPGREASPAVAGENLVGLAFDGRGNMIVAGTDCIYRLPWPPGE